MILSPIQKSIVRLTLGWEALCCRLNVRRHWWDEIDEGVLLGAAPFPQQLKQLRDLGVRGIVNMCLMNELPAVRYSDFEMECLHLPTVDRSPPTISNVHDALDFIARHRAAQQAVYVHCRAGRGRGATVALCWLIQAHNLPPADAYAALRLKRLQVDPALDRRAVVTEFWSQTSRAEGSLP